MIPEGWEHKSLVSLTLHLGRGKSPNYFESDTTIFAINQKCIRNGTVNPTMARGHNPNISIKSEVLLEDGDICVNSTGNGTIGRVGLWKTPVNNRYRYFADTHVTIVRPARDLVYPKFLAETLQSYAIQNSMEMECFTGSTNQVELNKSAFSALQILVPPINVQNKIAAILGSVDDTIQATQAIINQTRTVKQGLMQQLLTRGIGHTRFKQTEIGEIPETWSYGEVGDFLKLQRGFDITQKQAIPGEVPVISSSGISYYHNQSMIEPPGVITGRKGKLGKAYFVDIPYWPHDTSLFVKDFKGNDPRFIFWVLIGLKLEKFDAATAVPTLNRNTVHKIKIAIPPIDEQKNIVKILDSTINTIMNQKKEIDGLHVLKRGLMQDLLTGHVRVKPDEVDTT